jgi:hypothetical protein
MKHWDGRDRDTAELPLSKQERERLRAMFTERPTGRRPARPHVGSLIGLALALGVLAGVALVLAPADPVSPRLLP